MKILIIDDDLDALEITKLRLAKEPLLDLCRANEPRPTNGSQEIKGFAVTPRIITQANINNILCADGGIVGLEVARRENPDLILLDVDMPDMSGYDVCRALKSDRELCMIPVLFLSCSNDPNDIIRGLDCGAVDYIAKPFDPPQLLARVRAAIRTKRVQDILIENLRIDPLSDAPNHRMLMDRLKNEWSCCAGSRGHELILAQ